MKNISSLVILVGGLIAGYFAYPTINAKTDIDYEKMVQKIEKSIVQSDDTKHDEMLIHEVLVQSNRFHKEYESKLKDLEVNQKIRDMEILKATLESLKTPEAKQALLNVLNNSSQD